VLLRKNGRGELFGVRMRRGGEMDDRGFKITQDPESGKIISNEQTSERAAEIGALGGRKLARDKRVAADKLAEELATVLVDENDPRAGAMRGLLHELADAAGATGSGRTKAIETALSLIGSRPRETSARPNKDQTCPLCGRVDIETLSLTPAAQKVLQDVLGRGAWQIKAKQEGWHEPN